jgi:HlyD family secretion protein
MRKFLLAFATLAALGAGAWASIWSGAAPWRPGGASAASDKEPSIPSRRVEKRDIIRRARAIGVVIASQSRLLNAPFSGKIAKLAPEGTLVEKDQEVVWIATDEIENNIAELELQASAAKSDLERVQEELRLLELESQLGLEAQKARTNFAELRVSDGQRALAEQKLLVERQIAAPSTLEDSRFALLQAELSLREAKIDLKKAEQKRESDLRLKAVEIQRATLESQKREDELKREKAKLDKAVLKAPGAGFVNMLYTWRGQRAKIVEGDEVWEDRPIMEITDSTKMTAAAPINELDINKMKVGDAAKVRVAAIPGEVFEGKVSKKGNVPLTRDTAEHFLLPQDGVKLFEVVIEFERQDPRFRQQMTAFIEIEAGRAEGVLAAPIDAVFKGAKPDEWRAFAWDAASGSARETKVELGIEDENFVELKTSDPPLAEGDLLLFRDPSQPLPRNL